MWIIGNSNGVVPLIPGKTYMVGRKGIKWIFDTQNLKVVKLLLKINQYHEIMLKFFVIFQPVKTLKI